MAKYNCKEKLSLFVSEEIVKSLSTVDFSTIITEKCAAIVKEKVYISGAITGVLKILQSARLAKFMRMP